MSRASVIFIIFVIVLIGIAGVVAAAFEPRRVRENAAPDRIPRWLRRHPRRRGQSETSSDLHPAHADGSRGDRSGED